MCYDDYQSRFVLETITFRSIYNQYPRGLATFHQTECNSSTLMHVLHFNCPLHSLLYFCVSHQVCVVLFVFTDDYSYTIIVVVISQLKWIESGEANIIYSIAVEERLAQ